jgi:hypothetical protein
MIDQFENSFDDRQPPASPAPIARDYPPAPQGECTVEIVRAERRDVPWRTSDHNPRGECIVLRLAAGQGHAFVFADLPVDKPWITKHVAAAVGIVIDQCVPEELVGRLARVEIGHYTTRDGRTKAVVRKWLPGRPAPQQRQAAGDATPTLTDAIHEWASQGQPHQPKPPRPSRNALPPNAAGDDIPF